MLAILCWLDQHSGHPTARKMLLTVFLFELCLKLRHTVFKMSRAMKMCLMSYANNKGADQPAHPRSLITAFVVRCLDNIISLIYSRNFKTLASFCDCAGRFVSGLVGNSRRHVRSCRGSLMNGNPVLPSFGNIWAATWQNQQSEYAPSEDLDQPRHPLSLIRVFAVRMKKAWVLS